MRRIGFALLLILCFTGLTAAESLESYLSRYLMDKYQLDSTRVHITIHRTDVTQGNVEGFDVQVVPLVMSQPEGRFPVRVELYRDGSLIQKGSVTLDVQISADCLVPIRNIKRHDILTPALFKVERFDVTNQSETMLTDWASIENCRARYDLPAGRQVPIRRIERMPDVENGSYVTIVAESPLFEIRAKGIALEDGSIGESIKIKNIDSRKILVGTITDAGMVKVSL